MSAGFETTRFRNLLQGRDLDSSVTVQVLDDDYECGLVFVFPSGRKAMGSPEEFLTCITECRNMGDWEELQTICEDRRMFR